LAKIVVPALALLLGVGSWGSVSADPSNNEVLALLPGNPGTFRQATPVRPLRLLLSQESVNPDLFPSSTGQNASLPGGEVEYTAESGKRFLVELARFRRDSDAYSLLTIVASQRRSVDGSANLSLDGQVGTLSIRSGDKLAFFKGRTFIRISNEPGGSDEALQLAHLLAEKIDGGDGEVPALVMHLPDWQNAQKRAVYFTGFLTLQSAIPDQPVLAALEPLGDADAVIAEYGQAKLMIVEFNTPQLAADNDRLIIAKIQELKAQRQATPTSYRRVGNYGVFVFGATSEKAANDLIGQIRYEQVVSWLGDNPYWFKEAQRRYTETTLGVLVAVVKASGLTLVGCFGLGGLIGAILFFRRRRQQATMEAFSDAGGMLRLNLDEMTPQTDPARLLPGRN
jgi:hypothetical protein